MNRQRAVTAILQGSLLASFIGGCASAPVDFGQLFPDPNSDRLRGASYVEEAFPGNSDLRERMAHTLTIGNDSLRMFVELEEQSDYVVAKVIFFNATESIFDIGTGDFVLNDGNGEPLRPIDCHALANAVLGPNSNVPPFVPKPHYEVNKSIVDTDNAGDGGYVSGSKNRAQKGAPLITKVSSKAAFLYDIVSGVKKTATAAQRSVAEQLYESGIGKTIGIVPGSQHEFSVFWRNRPEKMYPLRLVLVNTDIDFTFGTDRE